jgi:23S rRNA (guanosine2251-2'-O)-methyltransferase
MFSRLVESIMKTTRTGSAEGEILCGVNPVLEQLRCDASAVRRVFVASGAKGGVARIIEAARQAGVEVVNEPSGNLQHRSGGALHQGVVAEVLPFRYADWHDLLTRKPTCILLADQIADPRNLGAIVRSAEAAGLGGVVVPKDRSAGVTAVTARASAGATSFVPIARVTNVARALEESKQAGYWIVGLDAAAEQDLFHFAFPLPCMIVVGSEGRGMRSLTRSACDYLVSIPMLGRVGSLNVSVAAAIASFEWVRQRQQIDSPRNR